MEAQKGLGKTWHKLSCFKCQICNARIEPGSETERQGKLACKNCGNATEGFRGASHANGTFLSMLFSALYFYIFFSSSFCQLLLSKLRVMYVLQVEEPIRLVQIKLFRVVDRVVDRVVVHVSVPVVARRAAEMRRFVRLVAPNSKTLALSFCSRQHRLLCQSIAR